MSLANLSDSELNPMMEFGRLLRTYRKLPIEPKLSQSAFAKALADKTNGAVTYSYATISLWERGLVQIRHTDRLILVGILHVLFDCKRMATLAQANQMLFTGRYSRLSSAEIERISPAWLDELTEHPSSTNPLTLPPAPPIVGMSASIHAIRHQLAQHTLGRLFVLAGVRGSGKSTLALHVANALRRHTDQPILGWIELNNEMLAPSQLFNRFITAFGTQQCGADFARRTTSRRADWLRATLQGNQGVLFVDGIQTKAQLDHFCTQLTAIGGRCRIVLTARTWPLDPSVALFTPAELDISASIQLFRQLGMPHANLLTDAQLGALRETFGGNPLVLRTVAGFIKRGIVPEVVQQMSSEPASSITYLLNDLFTQAWSAICKRDKQLLFAFLFIADAGASWKQLRIFGGLDNDVQLTNAWIRLTDHALVYRADAYHGYRIRPLTRQFLEQQCANHTILSQALGSQLDRVIGYWQQQFESADSQTWATLDPERHNLFQVVETGLRYCNLLSTTQQVHLGRYMRRLFDFIVHCGHAPEWLPLLHEATETLNLRAQQTLHCQLLTQAGILAHWLRRKNSAIDYHKRGLQLALKLESNKLVSQSAYNLGLAFYAIGNWGDTKRYAKRSLAICQQAQDAHGMGAVNNLLGLLATQQGDIGAAETYFFQAVTYLGQIGNSAEVARSLGNLALCYLDHDRTMQALRTISQAEAHLHQLNNQQVHLQLTISRAAVLLKTDELDAAARLLSAFSAEQIDTLGEPYWLAFAYHHRGWLAFRHHNYPAASQLLQKSCAMWDELGEPIEQARTRYCLAQVQITAGAHDKARSNHAVAMQMLKGKQHYAVAKRIHNKLDLLAERLYRVPA